MSVHMILVSSPVLNLSRTFCRGKPLRVTKVVEVGVLHQGGGSGEDDVGLRRGGALALNISREGRVEAVNQRAGPEGGGHDAQGASPSSARAQLRAARARARCPGCGATGSSHRGSAGCASRGALHYI